MWKCQIYLSKWHWQLKRLLNVWWIYLFWSLQVVKRYFPAQKWQLRAHFGFQTSPWLIPLLFCPLLLVFLISWILRSVYLQETCLWSCQWSHLERFSIGCHKIKTKLYCNNFGQSRTHTDNFNYKVNKLLSKHIVKVCTVHIVEAMCRELLMSKS